MSDTLPGITIPLPAAPTCAVVEARGAAGGMQAAWRTEQSGTWIRLDSGAQGAMLSRRYTWPDVVATALRFDWELYACD